MDTKKVILNELSSRIERLEEHADTIKGNNGNQFEALNHSVSKVIGAALTKELEDVRDFVQKL